METGCGNIGIISSEGKYRGGNVDKKMKLGCSYHTRGLKMIKHTKRQKEGGMGKSKREVR